MKAKRKMKPSEHKTVFEFQRFTATLVRFEEYTQTTELHIARQIHTHDGSIVLRFRDRAELEAFAGLVKVLTPLSELVSEEEKNG